MAKQNLAPFMGALVNSRNSHRSAPDLAPSHSNHPGAALSLAFSHPSAA